MIEERGEAERKRVRTGLIEIALLVIVATVVFVLDEVLRATQEGPRIIVAAPSAPGLQPGSTVWVAGRPVGRVLSVRFRPPEGPRGDNVILRAVLDRSIENVIREDATAMIHPSDFLEPVVLGIRPGSRERPPFRFSDTLRAQTSELDEERVRALGDSLRRAGAALAERGAEIRRMLEEGHGTLAALHDDPGPVRRLRRDLVALRSALSVGIEGGDLGRFAADSAIDARIRRIRSRIDALSDDGPEPAGVGLPETARAFDALADRLAELSRTLARGEGTAGRALHDHELGRQMALLRARLDSVIVELAGDPGRWLRVRLH